MPWINKVKPPHECIMPTIDRNEADIGSVWQCDECKKRWVVTNNGVAGMGWKHTRGLFEKKDEK